MESVYLQSNLFRIFLILGEKVKKIKVIYLSDEIFEYFLYLQILYEQYAVPV